MKLRGLFVTGTDTGVGKTVVAAAMLSAFRRAGLDAVPMKPVQTGARRETAGWRAPDLDWCLRAVGLEAEPDEYVRMAPACFALAASPHLAARVEKRSVSVPAIAAAFDRLAADHDLVVVEGAGGVLVPLDDRTTMLDLAGWLDLPAVVVARPDLGTVNHTLLTVRELRRAGRLVLGIVFCECRPLPRGGAGEAESLIDDDNPAIIERLSGRPILGRIPFIEEVETVAASPERFAAATASHLPPGGKLLERLGH